MSGALVLALMLKQGGALADSPSATPTVTSEAAAAKQSEAKRRFARGLELFNENDYAGALVEFRRAYALSPTYQVLYNIGQVSFLLQDYAGALKELQHYLADGGSEIPSARRSAVEKDLEKLRARVATLTIRTNVPGATVMVDDAVIGKSPIQDPIVVSVGQRKISAMLEGRPPIVRVVTVAGEESTTIDLALPPPSKPVREAVPPTPPASSVSPSPVVPASASAASTAPAPAPNGASSAPAVHFETNTMAETARAKVPSWPFWAVAGGLATTASILGIAAARTASDLDHERNMLGISRERLDDTRSHAAALALAADIVAGAAVVCGGLGLYVSLTGRSGPGAFSHRAKPDQSSVGIEVQPGTLRIRGAF